MAYEIKDIEAEVKVEIEERLQAYETNKNRTAGCLIELEGRVEN